MNAYTLITLTDCTVSIRGVPRLRRLDFYGSSLIECDLHIKGICVVIAIRNFERQVRSKDGVAKGIKKWCTAYICP